MIDRQLDQEDSRPHLCGYCKHAYKGPHEVPCCYCIRSTRAGYKDGLSDMWEDSRLTASEYQQLAARTINPDLTNGQIKAHALWGMAAEVGELQGLYQKVYQGHKLDPEHAKKEIGDILWMVAEYCTAQGWDLGEIMQLNIDKLKARYPDGFDPAHSLHRKDGDV